MENIPSGDRLVPIPAGACTCPSRGGGALTLSRVVDGRNGHLVGSIRQQGLQGHTAAFARSHDLQQGKKEIPAFGVLIPALPHSPESGGAGCWGGRLRAAFLLCSAQEIWLCVAVGPAITRGKAFSQSSQYSPWKCSRSAL